MVDRLIDRGLTLAEAVPADATPAETDLWQRYQEVDSQLISELHHSIQLHGDFTRDEHHPTSLTDKAFQALLDQYSDHQAAAEKLFSYLCQEYTVEPEHYVRGIANMLCRQDVSKNFKQNALHSLNYLMQFGGDHYNQAIANNLDFDEPNHFFRTAQFLEFVKHLYALSEDTDWGDGATPQIMDSLQSAVEQQKGSYLLQSRAQEVLNGMHTGESMYGDTDRMPFVISPGVYAYDFGEGLRLSSPENSAAVTETLAQIEMLDQQMRPPQHVIEQAIQRGADFVEVSVDPQLMRLHRNAWHQLYQQFDRQLTSDDIILSPQVRQNATAEQYDEALFDFQYLLSRPMRQKIEADFGVSLEDLSLPEKFQFLSLLKNAEAEEIAVVQSFVQQYGKDGIKTFLSVEHGDITAEHILNIGTSLDHTTAQKLFEKYSQITEAAQQAGNYVSQNFSHATTEDVERIQQNLLVKGQELLADITADYHNQLDPEEIMQQLQQLQADILLFTQSFQEVFADQEQPDFSTVKDLEFGSRQQLTAAEQAEMATIIKQNYADSPLAEGVLAGFRAAQDNPHNTFYLLKRQGAVISFYRFADQVDDADQPTGVTEFASFNAAGDYKGGGLGRIIMKNALAERARDHVVVAATDPTSRICQFYVEEAGFVIDGTETYKDTGMTVFHITNNGQNRFEEITTAVPLGTADEVVAHVRRALADGHVITSYRFDPESQQYVGTIARPVDRPLDDQAA